MNKQEIKFWARVFENAPDIPSVVMQRWIENPKALQNFLSGLVQPEKLPIVLKPVTISAHNINPCEFYRTRIGLWLSNEFFNCILWAASKRVISADKTTVGYIDRAKSVTDAEIGHELPAGYVFEDVDMFLVYLAALIKKQPGCQERVLLSDGCYNLFYVTVDDEPYKILVRYCSHDEVWQCFAGRLSAKEYCSCFRVFSATAK